MPLIQFVEGSTYNGYGLIFRNGDYADVDDEVAEKLLAVRAPDGKFRFKEMEDEEPESEPEESSELVTVQDYKDALDALEVEYPANARKDDLIALYEQATGSVDEGSDSSEAVVE